MTIADRQHAMTLRRLTTTGPADAAEPAPCVVVTWAVRDGDLRGVLEWRIGEASASALWRPEEGEPVTMASAAAVARVVDERGMEHVDVPGLLALTMRRTPDGARVIYARSTLLGVLGVRGGRVDHPEGRVEGSANEEPGDSR